jgi:acyl carrier protein
MERDKLLNEMAQVMEIDICDLNDDFDLKAYSLDSLVVVSMIAAIDIIYGVRMQGSDIEECITVKDIFNLIKLKQSSS